VSTDANQTAMSDDTAERVSTRARQVFMGLRDKDVSEGSMVLILLSRQVALLEEVAASVEAMERDR
jgi:hypothetical protein